MTLWTGEIVGQTVCMSVCMKHETKTLQSTTFGFLKVSIESL
jgi:hypothetical protein